MLKSFHWFNERATNPELMDDFSTGGDELSTALKHLRMLNRIFAAAGPTKYGVQNLWRKIGEPKQLSILDVGAGSGDVNLHLLKWAKKEQIDMNITLIDITKEACNEARLFFQDVSRVQIVRQDVFNLPSDCADIVTCSQFIHHFAGEELQRVIHCMLRASRYGVIINDIHRHWLAWSAVWLVTHLISQNRYIRHDGPLSVAKGFRASDWESLKLQLGLQGLTCTWRPLFRYAVMIPKVQRNDSR